MFDITRQLCKDSGYKQYETSNFARKGFECKHNISYWKYNDYIGVGPGAHGRVTMLGKKYATEEERNPDIWFEKIISLNSSTPKITPIENRVLLEEQLIMNLRISENIPVSIFDYEKLNPVVFHLEENKLIKTKDNEIVIRKRGKKMLDYIARSLVECF
tara:strand:- start:406 stop:882 length:477 start_codon:yes stop_codon:yes gene_type:complete